MKKTEKIVDFGQDEGTIKIEEFSALNTKNIDKENGIYRKKNDGIETENEKIEIKDNQYLKFFELNEEGLKLYGKYKKEQWLTVLKWSFLGTVLGFSMSVLLEIYAKKMTNHRKDVWKTSILFLSVGFMSFQGLQNATHTFKKRQLELVKKYGKEV